MLAYWYDDNAQPGERMLTTMPGVVRLFVPGQEKSILFTGHGSATTFPEFVKECYQKNVTYVVWDSRLGLCPGDSYYKSWKLQKLAPLARPRDAGPFEFVTRIERDQRNYLHIFKLKPLPEKPPSGEGQR